MQIKQSTKTHTHAPEKSVQREKEVNNKQNSQMQRFSNICRTANRFKQKQRWRESERESNKRSELIWICYKGNNLWFVYILCVELCSWRRSSVVYIVLYCIHVRWLATHIIMFAASTIIVLYSVHNVSTTHRSYEHERVHAHTRKQAWKHTIQT